MTYQRIIRAAIVHVTDKLEAHRLEAAQYAHELESLDQEIEQCQHEREQRRRDPTKYRGRGQVLPYVKIDALRKKKHKILASPLYTLFHQRDDYEKRLEDALKHLEELEIRIPAGCLEDAEEGPRKGILLAHWPDYCLFNGKRSECTLTTLLERAGYCCLSEGSYDICVVCNRAVELSPTFLWGNEDWAYGEMTNRGFACYPCIEPNRLCEGCLTPRRDYATKRFCRECCAKIQKDVGGEALAMIVEECGGVLDVAEGVALRLQIHTPDAGHMQVEARIRVRDVLALHLLLHPAFDDRLVVVAASKAEREETQQLAVHGADSHADRTVAALPGQAGGCEVEHNLANTAEIRRLVHRQVDRAERRRGGAEELG